MVKENDIIIRPNMAFDEIKLTLLIQFAKYGLNFLTFFEWVL